MTSCRCYLLWQDGPKWHQPSAGFVEALRPYIPDAEPAMQGLLSKLRETNLERKQIGTIVVGRNVTLSPLEIYGQEIV